MSDETRERDIYLAKAMGWRYIAERNLLVGPDGWLYAAETIRTPEAELWAVAGPEFHKSEDAKADLLRWLAADDARFEAFYDEIDALYDEAACETQFSVVSWSRFLVTLTPAQVAEAAEKALRGMETAKPSNGGEE